jgi:hypothetical protein
MFVKKMRYQEMGCSPLRLFEDSVSIYSSAYPYEGDTPKKRMMKFTLYPPLYSEKTKKSFFVIHTPTPEGADIPAYIPLDGIVSLAFELKRGGTLRSIPIITNS